MTTGEVLPSPERLNKRWPNTEPESFVFYVIISTDLGSLEKKGILDKIVIITPGPHKSQKAVTAYL